MSKHQGFYYFSSDEKFTYIIAEHTKNAKAIGIRVLGCKQVDITAVIKVRAVPSGYGLNQVYQHKRVVAA